MPKMPRRRGCFVAAGISVALISAGGCTASSQHADYVRDQIGPGPAERLAADVTEATPDTEVLTSKTGCGHSVVRGVFPDRVLFATARDEPEAEAAGLLGQLATWVERDAPGSEVTVLGHTDAIGSDAYNMDLSRRRALQVIRTLVAAGLDAGHLSAVAIGKRQPVADNATPGGRARNRRVEFLISDCLAANLGVVQSQDSLRGAPVDVMRLDPSEPYRLATVGRVSLVRPAGGPVSRATGLQPPAKVASPAPAPHYQPRTLSPDAQPNPLGPAVPF